MLVFTVVLGLGYTLLITGIGQLALPWQANGSPVTDADGTVVGQRPDRAVLHGCRWQCAPAVLPVPPLGRRRRLRRRRIERLEFGPENQDLITAIQDRQAAISGLDGVDVGDPPSV